MNQNNKTLDSPNQIISKKYLIFSISLSVLTMAGVVWYTYTPGILDYLAPKRLPGLVIALVVSFLRVWFSAAKIRFLSEKTISWWGAFRVQLSWDFTSAVTPSTIGGAPMATYAMTKEGLKLGESTAIILYSVLLDQIWFAIAIPILLFAGIYFGMILEISSLSINMARKSQQLILTYILGAFLLLSFLFFTQYSLRQTIRPLYYIIVISAVFKFMRQIVR